MNESKIKELREILISAINQDECPPLTPDEMRYLISLLNEKINA